MVASYSLLLDATGKPIPQYENAGATASEAMKGANGAIWVAGEKAHDGADGGNPVKIGGKVSTATPMPVSNADRVDAWFDEYGRLHVNLAQLLSTLGAAAPASGIVIAGSDGANARAIKTDADGHVQVDVLSLPVVDTELPAAAALADGAANPTAPQVGADEQLFNGATWDRKRNNLQGTLFASQARTATETGADQTNYNGRGIHLILNVTSIMGAPSIVLKIEGKSASGVYYTLLEGLPVTATGTHIYKVMPWATPIANEASADLLPRTWRVVVTHGNADSITYSVDYAIDC